MKIHLFELTPEQLRELITNSISELLQGSNLFAEPIKTDGLKELNTPKQTADFFGITKPCLHSWNKNGILKGHKIGGRVYYKRADILELTTQKKG